MLVDTSEERRWYALQALKHGRPSSVFAVHIANELHKQLGSAITNFEVALPPDQSELAQEAPVAAE